MNKDQRDFCICVAGHAIAIHAMHPDVGSLCRAYWCELPPEVEITITESDLEPERLEAKKSHFTQNDGYLETLAVYRKISEAMLAFDTFLMHGAVVAVNGQAFMFTAASGVGKTTHIRKWLKSAENAFVVNGDKPLIHVNDTQVVACGTPWCGKESLGTNAMVPLKAIALMERGEDNAMEEISFGQAFTFLLQQTYWPSDAASMKKTLALLSRLNGKVRFFRFRFNNLKDDAFPVAYRALTGNSPET